MEGMNVLVILIMGLWAGGAYAYNRPPPRETLFIPHSHSDSWPQQVHISVVGQDQMRISWITETPTPAKVQYAASPDADGPLATGTTSSYRYFLYKSGQIHDVVMGPLKPNTLYYYRLGDSPQQYNFTTPPSRFPIKFAVVGDLGQTEWTKTTLQHIANSNYDMLLLPGDLSYADYIQSRWDSFGRLVEPLASQRPWMVTQGNHEVEKIPVVHRKPFTAYNARWRMPFEQSGSDSNLYYSFDAAGVHVIMLGSYTDFDSGSPQYKWLVGDLKKVDRAKTPWLVVLLHAPWFNSNAAHRGEPESYQMKAAMEDLLYEARVDVVFAGHVHAYERFTRVYRDKANSCGPVHITIGDGGNREGLATKFLDPKPEISIFREASFGHGILEVVNATHALWTWHRNDDDEAVPSDSFWLTSLSIEPACEVH
ncbi:probable purple acid phosphatase 20 [Neltuma alba]|uniref:probable purple acid phosphatase 20 n=1 Tax=Neltuma alba TaxID=207710 RepID=UPI0010A48A68|nr:probable purple acid phosphatase 20 [Prosopis alba]XP_028795431.1 probable purple acid phosphatase 20 [Prosopis alba]